MLTIPIKAVAGSLLLLLALVAPSRGTALNVVQTDDAVHFFSDGGEYDGSGVLVGVSPKVFPVIAARCAVGASGPFAYISLASTAMGQAGSIGDVLAYLEKSVRELSAGIRDSKPGPWDIPIDRTFTVIVGGFTEAGERQVWIMQAAVKDQRPAFALFRGSASFRPPIEIEVWRGTSALPDINQRALAVLEDQRRARPVPAYSGVFSIVGVYAQATIVTFDAITTRILKRWPDVIGQPIKGN